MLYLHHLIIIVPVPLTIITVLCSCSVMTANHGALVLGNSIECVQGGLFLGAANEFREIQIVDGELNFSINLATAFRVLESLHMYD